MINRTTLTNLIAEMRGRDAPDDEIADAILSALSETDAVWAKALSHPARGRIINLLRDNGTLSPVGAARELDQSVGAIAYHFRQLQKLGFIEMCGQIPRRGATEHVYRLRAEPSSMANHS